MGTNAAKAAYLFEDQLAEASRGSPQAYFDLGIAYSTGTDGCDVDLIEAHKWFNLAALAGVSEGHAMRADVSADMGRDEIAAAQRAARAWIDAMRAGPSAQRYAA
jgi:uncharacterized protein